jgi:hypothetical protein
MKHVLLFKSFCMSVLFVNNLYLVTDYETWVIQEVTF